MLHKISRIIYVLYKKLTLPFIVSFQKKQILAQLETDKKGLFIDCGSNVGQAFTYFQGVFPFSQFDYTLIEPNPYCKPFLEEKIIQAKAKSSGQIELIEKAADVKKGETKFFGLVEWKTGNVSQGASTNKDHNTKYYQANEEKAVTVPTFSFASLLKEKSKEYDVIIVKMDIESGEYPILDDLIKKDMIKHISHLYIEFHSAYMAEPKKSEYRQKELDVMQRFKEQGVPLTNWI